MLVFRCTQPCQSPDAWIMRFFLWVWLEAWFWILIIGNSHSASANKNVNTGKSTTGRMHGEIKYVFISASIEVDFKMTVILLSAIANCLYFFRHSIDNMRTWDKKQSESNWILCQREICDEKSKCKLKWNEGMKPICEWNADKPSGFTFIRCTYRYVYVFSTISLSSSTIQSAITPECGDKLELRMETRERGRNPLVLHLFCTSSATTSHLIKYQQTALYIIR